jgi:hypothetical protein
MMAFMALKEKEERPEQNPLSLSCHGMPYTDLPYTSESPVARRSSPDATP